MTTIRQQEQLSGNGGLTLKKRSNSQQNSTNMKTNDPKQLSYVEPVLNTPFSICKADEKYFLAIGKYRITEIFTTEKEALNEVNTINWKTLTNVIVALIETINNKKL
jgi:hypothetical protein